MSGKAPRPSDWFKPRAGPPPTSSGRQQPTSSSPQYSTVRMHEAEQDRRHDSAVDPAWQDVSLDDDLLITHQEMARKNSLDFFSAAVGDRPVSWQAPRWSTANGGGKGIAGPSRPPPRPASSAVAKPENQPDVARKDSFSMVLDLAKELEITAEQQRPQQPVYPLPGPPRKPGPSRCRQGIGPGSEMELPHLIARSSGRTANGPRTPPLARLLR